MADFCWAQLEWVEKWGITRTHRPPHKAGSLSRSGTPRLAQLAVPEHTGHRLPPPVPISTHAHHIQIHQALLARWTRSLLLAVMLGDQIQCWSFTGKWLPHWTGSSSLLVSRVRSVPGKTWACFPVSSSLLLGLSTFPVLSGRHYARTSIYHFLRLTSLSMCHTYAMPDALSFIAFERKQRRGKSYSNRTLSL